MLDPILRLLHPWRRVIFAVYVAWVLMLTLAPLPSEAGRLPDWFDKVAHLGLLAGFAALLHWNLVGRHQGIATVVLASGAAFAAGIELAQGPIAFRTGDTWDFVWGVAGAAVGFVAAKLTIPAPR